MNSGFLLSDLNDPRSSTSIGQIECYCRGENAVLVDSPIVLRILPSVGVAPGKRVVIGQKR